MKQNELVWRALIDAAATGHRKWQSIADLAFASGVPWATAQLACRKLVDIGAITKYSAGGFSVVSPEKVLVVACAARSLAASTLTWTNHDGAAILTRGAHAVGGFDAAVVHLGGTNTEATYTARTIYVPQDAPGLVSVPEGRDVRVLPLDARAAINWDGVSSLAQTMVDLFATPGWQATQFRIALQERYFAGRDWDQRESPGAL